MQIRGHSHTESPYSFHHIDASGWVRLDVVLIFLKKINSSKCKPPENPFEIAKKLNCLHDIVLKT